MAHEDVLTAFVIVTALAVVIQAGILLAIFLSFRKLMSAISRVESLVKDHVNPLLDSAVNITNSAREPLKSTLANVTEMTNLLRQRTVSADAVVAEVLERVRAQTIRIDQLLTGVLGRAERAADAAERGVLAPVREISAVLAGVRRGLGYFFFQRRPAGQPRPSQEEELFI
jgi:hypothetical protein